MTNDELRDWLLKEIERETTNMRSGKEYQHAFAYGSADECLRVGRVFDLWSNADEQLITQQLDAGVAAHEAAAKRADDPGT